MAYWQFWHQYMRHRPGNGSAIRIDPAELFFAVVCLAVLLAWWAFQIQARCLRCGAVPARCRCDRDH